MWGAILKADNRFKGQPLKFWGYVRAISQEIGYTDRKTRGILVPNIAQIQELFCARGLSLDEIVDSGNLTAFGTNLLDYFNYRSDILNNIVRENLMNKEEAEELFRSQKSLSSPQCKLPFNKQKDEKKDFAFLTCIVNMLIERELEGLPCDYDPRSLTTITINNRPFWTLSRRVDGSFPSVTNPIAILEIKEYYYTTTFGSRVADGVYESLLDGYELNAVKEVISRKIQHLLIVDGYFTWWERGRSYLCRLIDMLNMGYVDEVLFGKEVVEELPLIVANWKEIFRGMS